MALKQNGGAHLSSDIDFIPTPKAPADVLSTGKNPGVPLTNASLVASNRTVSCLLIDQ
jgi:sphingolipid C9-methyltransferase